MERDRHRAMIRPWRRRVRLPVRSTPMSIARRARESAATWLGRWSPILPILVAEFVVWLGFGALLPILPLYFRDHGVDFTTLGFIIAAWPAARLIGEPIFGWVADRTRRVPLMVAGSALAGVFVFLPLVFVGRRPVHDLPGPRRPVDGDVRPGGARHDHRRDAARAARRGVRPVLGVADGRPALRAGDRRARDGAVRRRRVRVRVRRRQLDPRGRRSSGCSSRRRRARARARATASYDAAEFPARPALVAGDETAPAPRSAAAAAQPAPARGDHHQHRRATSRPARTTSSGACTSSASAPGSS